MRIGIHLVLTLSICFIIVSPMTSQAAKYSWDIDADGNSYDYEIFNVDKDNLMLKMRVKVFEGGPVSVFILDEDSFNAWNGGYGSEVVAYAGTSNITLGRQVSISGQLGPARDNISGWDINYYIVIDNRGTDRYSNVLVEIISTLPTTQAYLVILVLVPLALIVKRREIKTK